MTIYVHLDLGIIVPMFLNIVIGFVVFIMFSCSYNELNEEIDGKKFDPLYFIIGILFLIIIVSMDLTLLNIVVFN